MLRFLILITTQCFVSAAAQILLKIGLNRLSITQWSWSELKLLFKDLPLISSGILMLVSTGLWIYIIKNFKFTIAYPLSTMTYIFGMIGAVFFLDEPMSQVKWFGVSLIVIGAFLILK